MTPTFAFCFAVIRKNWTKLRRLSMSLK